MSEEDAANFVLKVKPLAYIKMLLHALRFGSTELKKSQLKEIMGTCVGKVEGDDPVIYDAVPMTHGRRIEVEWSEEQYIAQSAVDDEILSKGMFVIAWYHSHPAMGTFLSAADKKNHLFFQQVNPKATALVFDHAMLETEQEDDVAQGFDAFRLTNINAGINSDFEPVKVEVEDWETIKPLVRQMVDLVDRFHKKDPIMPEIGETADLFESFNVEAVDEIDETFIDSEVAAKVLGAGLPEDVKTEYLPKFIENLNAWTKSTTTKVYNTTAVAVTNLRNMKNALSEGLQRLQNWFQKTLRDNFADISFDVAMMQDDLKKLVTQTEAARAAPESGGGEAGGDADTDTEPAPEA